MGKIGIPDTILRKPGPLDAEEWVVMRSHAQLGEQILNKVAAMVYGRSYMSLAASIAGGHHEKWNGKGSPRGLGGTNIPLEARIVAVADVYDALVSKRPYKNPWLPADASALIRKEAGVSFDPIVVEAFLEVSAGLEFPAA